MPVTERLILPVQGGQEQWKDSLKSMLQTLKTQEGYIRTRWGPHSENENNLELLIGWESEAAQAKFQSGPEFGPALANFAPHLRAGEKPSAYFIQFTPYAPKEIIDAALVQLVTVTMAGSGSGGASASAKEGEEESIRASLNKYAGLEGCTGVAGGYATSEIEGKKVFVGIMGWSSLEASQKSKGLVKVDVEGGSVEEHHVNFRYPIKGFRGL